VRPAVLFNYVGPSTLNADFLRDSMEELGFNKPSPPLSQAKLDKRGFLSFVFDGRYKFTRHYAPSAFNTPRTLEEHNLALEPQKNRETILRMNELLNSLIAKEVGANDGRFLAPFVGPK